MSYAELYHRIYAAPLSDIRTFMLVLLFGWTVLTFLFGLGHQSARVWMIINRALAVCSVLGILFVTVLSRGNGATGVSLRLFHIPAEDWLAREYRRMLLMNVFLYLPLGLSLSNAWPTAWALSRRTLYTAAGGIAVSLACELLQFLLRRGTAEIDDLVTNTAGTLLGVFCIVLACGILRLIKHKKEHNE